MYSKEMLDSQAELIHHYIYTRGFRCFWRMELAYLWRGGEAPAAGWRPVQIFARDYGFKLHFFNRLEAVIFYVAT